MKKSLSARTPAVLWRATPVAARVRHQKPSSSDFLAPAPM